MKKGEHIDLFLDWLREQILSIGGESLPEENLFDERQRSLITLIENELAQSLSFAVVISLPRVDTIKGQRELCRISCMVAVMRNVAMAGEVDSYQLAKALFCGLHASHFLRDFRQVPNVECHNLAHTCIEADVLHTFEVSVETAFIL